MNLEKIENILDSLGINTFITDDNKLSKLDALFGLTKRKHCSYGLYPYGVKTMHILPYQIVVEYYKGDISNTFTIYYMPSNIIESLQKRYGKDKFNSKYPLMDDIQINGVTDFIQHLIKDRKKAIKDAIMSDFDKIINDGNSIASEYLKTLNNGITSRIAYGHTQVDNENKKAILIEKDGDAIGYISFYKDVYGDVRITTSSFGIQYKYIYNKNTFKDDIVSSIKFILN